MVKAEKYVGRVVKLCYKLSKGLPKNFLNGLSEKNRKKVEDVKAQLDNAQTQLTTTMRTNGSADIEIEDSEKVCQEGQEVLDAIAESLTF